VEIEFGFGWGISHHEMGRMGILKCYRVFAIATYLAYCCEERDVSLVAWRKNLLAAAMAVYLCVDISSIRWLSSTSHVYRAVTESTL
jgi:hypothetical protein